MKIIKKSQAKIFKNSDKCIAHEYSIDDKDINGALIELSGRYPDEGRVMNEVCKELVYVIDGSGVVVVEGQEIELGKGDEILIELGERYYFDGTLTILTSCTPAWYSEQHVSVR